MPISSQPARSLPEVDQTIADERLAVERALADPATFEPIFDQYWPLVHRYCGLRISNPEDAEDAAIRVMTNAYLALGRFRGNGNFRSWLFSIAHNEVTNVYRTRSRNREGRLDELAYFPAHEKSPEEHALAMDDQDMLLGYVRTLPGRSREVVELRICGFTDLEIASILGISGVAVRQAQSRAVDGLRQLMTAEVHVEGRSR